MQENKNAGFPFDEEQALENRIKKKKSKAIKAVIIVVSIILVFALLLGALVIAGNIYLDNMLGLISYDTGEEDWSVDRNPNGGGEKPGEAPTPSEMPPYEIIDGWYDGNAVAQAYENEVINVLLIGADTLDGNHARSDTMILMSINPVKQRLVLTSFMRDSYIELPGNGYNRINAAHSKGGAKYLIETIEANFGIDIDNYAKVDFTSFQQAIEAIGGVTLTVNDVNYNYFYDWDGIRGLSEAEATDGSHTVHLNGEQALKYARTRKGHRVENSDFGRTLHQRDLLSQFVYDCRDASLDEIHSLLESVLPYVVTDMPQDELKKHIFNVLTYISYDLQEARVPCDGSYEDLTLVSGAMVLNINVPANAKYVKAKIYG